MNYMIGEVISNHRKNKKLSQIELAEMLAANSGIGYLIYTSRLYYRTDWIFVGIATLGVIGFVLDKLLRKAGTALFRHYSVTDE